MTQAAGERDDAMLETLNAYLDGELSTDEARRVETRLADDPAWAAELRRLERAWDLLDYLPKIEAPADFTQSTVEMIAVSAAADLAAVERPRPRRRWFDVALLTAGALAAALGGYLTIDRLRPQRDDAMLQTLPVLRHLDLYSRTEPGESVEFIRMLQSEPPLPPPPPNRDGH
jgi:hypothetical protein